MRQPIRPVSFSCLLMWGVAVLGIWPVQGHAAGASGAFSLTPPPAPAASAPAGSGAAYLGFLQSLQNAGAAIAQSLATSAAQFSQTPPAQPASVGRAVCGPGSTPETGLQGQVPLADRQSGRSQQGYTCNLERVGQYQGEGATWVNPFYGHCAYMGTAFNGLPTKRSQGVQVVDLSNPAKPRLSAHLTSPAMAVGTWESLKVNDKRGLLAGVAVGPLVGAAFFDVYDLNPDCSQPVLKNGVVGRLTLPANVLGHEGQWSPDGLTYWASGLNGGGLTAIDVRDPRRPRVVYTGSSLITNHGFELSEDGNRLYLTTAFPAGVIVLDVSDVQSRKSVPIVRQIGSVFWTAAGVSQHSIPVTVQGRPMLIVADEFAAQAVRFIDLSNERQPKVVQQLQLEIQLPQHRDERTRDTTGNGLFGYEAHYCSVDRRTDPTALACGFLQSGVRVFDIRKLSAIREIAYFNPPAQVGKGAQLPGSEHTSLGIGNVGGQSASDLASLNRNTVGLVLGRTLQNPSNLGANLTADYCSSPPKFVGADQLWVTCQDNGVLALKFKNGAYPLK